MQNIKKILSLSITLTSLGTLSNIAYANDFQDCQNMFFANTPPQFIEQKLEKNTYPLCFHGFAVMYSGVSRTPFWSAEFLTKDRINQAEQLPREDNFHEEKRLPARFRANLADYSKSGFDRGHLSPNGDMADLNQQYDSFSLANIAPQSPRNNRYIWRNIESDTRQLAKQYGQAYVVTGVTFNGEKINQLNKRVLVPSHFYKAIYIPKLNKASVYYAPNDESERFDIISLDELNQRIGIDVMPAISPEVKAETYQFSTEFSDKKSNQKKNQKKDNDESAWWVTLIATMITWLINQLNQ